MSDDSTVDEQKVLGKAQEEDARLAQKKLEEAKILRKNTSKSQANMEVRVHSPFRTYYDGSAYSLSAENATGPFDILPRHHNFISLLLPCELTVRTVQEGELKIRISGGLIHVKANRVIVFLDI